MPRKRIYTPKIIADPIYGVFDIRPVLPMVETEEFQALADKRQLGYAHLIFPSATHTRLAHSLGAYAATRELANRWTDFGFITKREADALSGYALYHDLGHPAFSHVTEDLCEGDNDELGVVKIKRLKKQIEASSIDYDLLLSLATHENPLYRAVHDKNLGMEKLDYLERDGLNTILSRPSGIDYLRKHIYFIDKTIMIDERVIDNALEVQNFYLKMYKNVYLRKTSVIAQRMVQKIVHLMIEHGDLTAKDLPDLTDSELIGIMHTSNEKEVHKLYGHLRRRELFREAIVIRHKKYLAGKNPEKAVAFFGFNEKEIEKLIASPDLQNKNQRALAKLERQIADIAAIPENEVLVVPVFNAWRFRPNDITVYRENGPVSLKDRYPAHFHNLEETARSYFAFRICTREPYRSYVSHPTIAKKIVELVSGSNLNQ